MNRTTLIALLGLGLVAFLPGPAHAMPAGEQPEGAADEKIAEPDLFQHVVDKRRSAREQYETMQAERLEKLNRAAARETDRTDQVPGWNLASPKAAAAPVPEDPTDTKGLYILLLVGAGIVLSLALRILAPFLFDRKPKQMRAGEPMTIKLRPREERRINGA